MLSAKTHVVGTMRKNKKIIPDEIKDARLQKGGIIAKESEQGITIIKWKDKRDVFMFTTGHKGTKQKL